MSWNLDESHSKVGFSVRHMMVSTVDGEFDEFDAELDLDPDDPEQSSVRAVIDAESIDTGDDERDDHLRSEDFFDTETHPTIEFESTDVESDGDGVVEVTGDLTIRGETRSVTLRGEQRGPAEGPWWTTAVGYTLGGEIDREDFGLTWNKALETGGVLVGNEVSIEIDAEVVEEDDGD